MPLDPSGLAAGIAAALAPAPPGVNAQMVAQAYATYAAAALCTTGVPPVFTGAEAAAFATVYQAGSLTPGLPATAAAALARACTTFWTLPPVAFPGGAATAVPGEAAAVGALTAAFAAPSLTAAETASKMATALDAMTRTVVVTFAPPLPPGTLL